MFLKFSSVRRFAVMAVIFFSATAMSSRADAAFHLWDISEVYSNSSGTLQYIEFFTFSSSQQFVQNTEVTVSNSDDSIQHTFTIPSHLPSDSANKHFLIGTAGIQAAGGPAPDFIIPNNFLFTAGGSILFFGTNSDTYTALPTDGTLSRTWQGGNAVNSPRNFAGQTGLIVVPEASSILGCTICIGLACSAFLWQRREKSLSLS